MSEAEYRQYHLAALRLIKHYKQLEKQLKLSGKDPVPEDRKVLDHAKTLAQDYDINWETLEPSTFEPETFWEERQGNQGSMGKPR